MDRDGLAAGMASAPTRWLLPLGALVALTYLAGIFIDAPFPAEPLWKAAGIVLLGVYALGAGARLAAAALFFSAAGDAALAFEPPRWTAGMALFGIAHLFYAAAFADLIRKGGLRRTAAPAAALVIAVSLALLVWLWPAMGSLRAPGLAYQAVITAMAALALLSPAPAPAKFGALIFMVSDTLIALGLYKDIPVIPGAVWLTYVAAQFALAAGLAAARMQVK